MRRFLALPFVALALQAAPVDRCDYADDAAAARAWRGGEGAPSARVTTADGRRVLRLDCPFSRATGPRLTWDLRLGLDLSHAEGLRLELRCPDRRSLGQVMVYLETPAGWHNVDRVTLSEARVVFAGWIDDYNAYRPHGAIGYLTPDEFTGREPGLRPSGLTQEPSKTTLREATQL
jgi:transposase InsO family protein